jgi:isopentenyl-diphosphate Delta-isomerase
MIDQVGQSILEPHLDSDSHKGDVIEEVILVDAQDREVGVREKIRAHQEGALHRAVSVFIFDDRGRLLLQQRAAEKYHSGGLWSNTACGHPRPGESVLAAARRRLLDEMGFECPLERLYEFTYDVTFDNGLTEREYDHVLVGEYSGPVNADPSEVGQWAWVSREDLERSLAAEQDAYTYWFKLVIGDVIRRVEERFR